MANTKTLTRSFSGGEVTEEFWGRIDDPKFQTGLAKCLNFIPLPHGPVANRAGTSYTRETKNSSLASVVRPFSFSSTQTMVLEFGAQYVRFHTMGATLLRGAVAAYSGATAYTPGDLAEQAGVDYVCIKNTTGNAPPNATYWYAQPATGEYEVPTPYAAADVDDLHFVQSLDVLTITHVSYPVQELRRAGAVKWYMTQPAFVSSLSPPTGVGAVATSPSGGSTKTQSYVVTTVGQGADESLQSAVATCLNNLAGIGNLNTVSWAAAAGATRYNVYKLEGGTYGFIGQSTTTTFVDDNIAADTAYAPPENVNPFSSVNNYPAACTYHEQRRCFAGTNSQPQNFWATRSGTESNLQYAIPTRDDDAIMFRIAARENQTIRHMVPLLDLIILTASAEFVVQTSGSFTPTSFAVKPRSFIGSNNVTPLAPGNTVLFAAARGGHVRELGFSTEQGGYITGDLSLRAPHLFDDFDIVDAAFSKSPYPIAWWVSSNGKLLSLTYVPEQNIFAWAQHDTDGLFESCCCVAEGREDVLYVVVNRTINGATKRYVERLASRRFATQADAFFVDCGLSYAGAPATTFSGLDHLEGKTVSILGDGAVFPQQIVTGGSVSVDTSVSKAQIGLPLIAELQTLPMAVEAQAFAQARVKNVNSVTLRVFESLGFKVGPDLDTLREHPSRTFETFGSPPNLQSLEAKVVIDPTWQDGAQVYVRQDQPLPCTILSMVIEAEIAG